MTEYYSEMMQERLDGNLDAQREAELLRHLQQAPEAAEQNASLEAVHDMLVRAPLERAPSRLAATIMARLARAVQEQAERQELPEEVKQALLLAMNLVILQMTPVLLASSYMVLNAQARPKALSNAVNRTVMLMVMMIDGMGVLIDEMEALVREDPRMAPVALSLMPTIMTAMLNYLEDADHLDNIRQIDRHLEALQNTAPSVPDDDEDDDRISRLSGR